MKASTAMNVCFPMAAALALLAILSGRAAGQSSSLFMSAQERGPLTLNENSWTYQPPEQPRTLKLHDLVTVVVSEKSSIMSDGKIDRKKKGYQDWLLSAWIKMYNGNLGEDAQANGQPHIRGEIDNKLQAEGNLQVQDSLSFSIACSIVDIRPNGNIVLEGHSTIKSNEEVWDYSVSGETRADAIKPNNTVVSQDVANMQIVKKETGHVRDSYRRGWALEFLDKWQPF